MTRRHPSHTLTTVNSTDNNIMRQDEFWMRKALNLARLAGQRDEVPVGALLVAQDGKTLLGKGLNRREEWRTPLGHAELITLHRASQKLQAWRLLGSTLYVTLEPCLMCAGALLQARVARVVYGAVDPKGGAAQSLYQVLQDPRLNHRCDVSSGTLGAECGQMLTDYFRKKRALRK